MRLKWVIGGLGWMSSFCVLYVAVVGLASVASARSDTSGRLTVYVVNYPLKYFAERIGGDAVTVVFPAPADEDPAYWMPDAKTISDYQKADLILLNEAMSPCLPTLHSLPH